MTQSMEISGFSAAASDLGGRLQFETPKRTGAAMRTKPQPKKNPMGSKGPRFFRWGTLVGETSTHSADWWR